MPYIDLQTVLDKLVGIDTSKISNLNEKISSVFIPSAQAAVNAYLGYNIDTQTQTKYYDGNGLMELPLGVAPIQDVSECIIYSIPYSSVLVTFSSIAKKNVVDCFGNVITTNSAPGGSTDLVVDCALGILEIPETTDTVLSEFVPMWPAFVNGRANVKVTLTSGYPTASMPQQVKDAGAYFATILVLYSLGANASKGATSIKIGQVQKDFGSRGERAFAYSGLITEYDNLIQLLLASQKGLNLF